MPFKLDIEAGIRAGVVKMVEEEPGFSKFNMKKVRLRTGIANFKM